MGNTDIRLVRSAAPYGTITATDNTATEGKFVGFIVTTAVAGLVILDQDSTDITTEITKSGAALGAGAYHTPRAGKHISSVIHDGAGEITLVYLDEKYT